jgi:hypothetical protein
VHASPERIWEGRQDNHHHRDYTNKRSQLLLGAEQIDNTKSATGQKATP